MNLGMVRGRPDLRDFPRRDEFTQAIDMAAVVCGARMSPRPVETSATAIPSSFRAIISCSGVA